MQCESGVRATTCALSHQPVMRECTLTHLERCRIGDKLLFEMDVLRDVSGRVAFAREPA